MSDKNESEVDGAVLVADDDGSGVYMAVVALADIDDHERNYNHHPQHQIDGLVASIKEFGYVKKMVLQERGGGGYTAVAGHGIKAALAIAGYVNVRVEVIPESWSVHKVLAYLVADNEQAKAAVVQDDMLQEILRDVAIDGGEEMLEVTGISQEEVDAILAGIGAGGDSLEDGDAEPEISRADELRDEWGVELGQLWILPSRTDGQDHRLICGDCTETAVVERVMGGDVADIEIHDPPYGMNLDTDFSGMESEMFKGKTGGAYDAPVMGDDEDFDPSHLLKSNTKEIFLWGADYYAERIKNKNEGSWVIWDKRMDESADKMWGSCFETLWSKNRHKRDFIRVKWAGVFGMENEPDKKRMHPTQKPVLVYTWLLEKYSQFGNITADYYLGAGSHLIAAENLSRQCRAAELSPAYVAVALQRYQDAFGITPHLAQNNKAT